LDGGGGGTGEKLRRNWPGEVGGGQKRQTEKEALPPETKAPDCEGRSKGKVSENRKKQRGGERHQGLHKPQKRKNFFIFYPTQERGSVKRSV